VFADEGVVLPKRFIRPPLAGVHAGWLAGTVAVAADKGLELVIALACVSALVVVLLLAASVDADEDGVVAAVLDVKLLRV